MFRNHHQGAYSFWSRSRSQLFGCSSKRTIVLFMYIISVSQTCSKLHFVTVVFSTSVTVVLISVELSLVMFPYSAQLVQYVLTSQYTVQVQQLRNPHFFVPQGVLVVPQTTVLLRTQTVSVVFTLTLRSVVEFLGVRLDAVVEMLSSRQLTSRVPFATRVVCMAEML